MRYQNLKHLGFQLLVRPEVKKYSADGMVVIDTIPRLVADFGEWEAEGAYTNPITGAREIGANIRGGYFDSEIAQQQNGWTDEERELVELSLKREIENRPDNGVRFYEEAKPPAPWPTYDDTHHKQIPTLAETLGLVEPALAYERQNKNRAEVVKLLEEALAKTQVEEELTAA